MCDDTDEAYMILDCDHSMGMTVIGTPENSRSFNFITSYFISPFEYEIMGSIVNSTGPADQLYQSYSDYGFYGSVTLDLIQNYRLDNSSVETFTENGYEIVKNVNNDFEFLVYDPETGICRDINTINNFCGAWDYRPVDQNPLYPDNVNYPPGTIIFMDVDEIITVETVYWDLGCIAGDWSDPIAEPGVVGFPFGSTLIYGPVGINWDGYGHVYIAGGYWFWANHNPAYDPYIYTVGSMLIQVNNQTIGPLGNENTYNNFNRRDIDISNFLQNGTNSITITIKSSARSWLGGIAIANGYLWAVESSLPVKDYRVFPLDANLLGKKVCMKRLIGKNLLLWKGHLKLYVVFGTYQRAEDSDSGEEMKRKAAIGNQEMDYGEAKFMEGWYAPWTIWVPPNYDDSTIII